jgi:large subunit ribosomal protein L31
MQEGIHPQLNLLKVHCSCGNVIETTSTLESLHVEICSACHPFYTGKQKLIDTEGRVERYISIRVDISKRKQKELQLIEQLKEKSCLYAIHRDMVLVVSQFEKRGYKRAILRRAS